MMVPGRKAVLLLFGLALSRPLFAQTPSPLADWQYSAGEVLQSVSGEPIPDWRETVGLGVSTQPSFVGAKGMKVLPSMVLDLRYKDIAFASDGEGIGVNLLHGEGYRAGFSLSYDLGRNSHDDDHLRNLPNIAFAPAPKAFAQIFIEPFVLAVDIRKAIGGNDGLIGEIGVYVPIPFDDDDFLLIGPAVTWADHRYTNAYFGVSEATSKVSGFAPFRAHGGLANAGAGASFVHLMGDHWLVEGDTGYRRLLGDAARSPIVETKLQFSLDVNLAYRF
jgi:outer membrane scaffolding protein for murein synthesis (MipA/OmpV family)